MTSRATWAEPALSSEEEQSSYIPLGFTRRIPVNGHVTPLSFSSSSSIITLAVRVVSRTGAFVVEVVVVAVVRSKGFTSIFDLETGLDCRSFFTGEEDRGWCTGDIGGDGAFWGESSSNLTGLMPLSSSLESSN